jgi:ferredoxin-NADP reductase
MEFLFPLEKRREIAEGTMAFWFDIKGSGYTFKPGQHADFTLLNPGETDEKGNMRTFSFASAPGRGYIMIATRMRGSAFKNSLKSMPLGTKVKVSEPYGDFILHKDVSRPAVFLAGGIGITPFRSILEWAVTNTPSRRIFLFYSNKSRQDSAFLDDLEKWSHENPNFKLIATATRSEDPSWPHERGRIDESMLKKHLGNDIGKSVYYAAGPPVMVEALTAILVKMGVDEDSIRKEQFAGY